MSQQTVAVTDSDFQEKVVKDPGVKLVDFWAEWCGPCKSLSPVVDSIAEEYFGKVSVYKLDIDTNPETAQQYQIRSIPTLLVFKDGKLVDRVVGAQPKDNIVRALKAHL